MTIQKNKDFSKKRSFLFVRFVRSIFYFFSSFTFFNHLFFKLKLSIYKIKKESSLKKAQKSAALGQQPIFEFQ